VDEAPYSLLIAPAVRRALTDDLPEAVAVAAWEFISGPLAANPHIVGARLRAPFDGQWRARRGQYRVRYDIDEAARVVRVLDVEHRRDSYRS
jgi:mRNA-degrading endonuclease RelE of RelBE toxin-antitoxin system